MGVFFVSLGSTRLLFSKLDFALLPLLFSKLDFALLPARVVGFETAYPVAFPIVLLHPTPMYRGDSPS